MNDGQNENSGFTVVLSKSKKKRMRKQANKGIRNEKNTTHARGGPNNFA